jgi:hypothetical protein
VKTLERGIDPVTPMRRRRVLVRFPQVFGAIFGQNGEGGRSAK